MTSDNETSERKPPGAFLRIEPYPSGEGVLAQVDWWWTYGPQLALALFMTPFILLAAELIRRLSSE